VAGAKPILDDLLVGMDRLTAQLLLFDDSLPRPPRPPPPPTGAPGAPALTIEGGSASDEITLPLELLADHQAAGLDFHTDLLDCNVDICSPELMVQFSDNFDYQDIRKDFIHNEVGNWALGKHIYGYIIQVFFFFFFFLSLSFFFLFSSYFFYF
jgi:translation initiation factor eIF-2B subunit epsilon